MLSSRLYVPTRGYVWHETATALAPMKPIYVRCNTGVVDARRIIVQAFLEDPTAPDVLVMCDDDVVPGEEAGWVVSHVVQGRADVCAAVVPICLEGTVLLPNVFIRDDSLPRGYKLSAELLRERGLQEVDAVGTGFIAIHRRVLTDRRMKDPFRTDFLNSTGEDVFFCKRAKAARFGVFADFDVWCDHHVEISANALSNAYVTVINAALDEGDARV